MPKSQKPNWLSLSADQRQAAVTQAVTAALEPRAKTKKAPRWATAEPSDDASRCYVCGMPMRSLEVDRLELDLRPKQAPGRTWVLVHGWCDRADVLGEYWIELDRIIAEGNPERPHEKQDSLHNWIAHLKGKVWFWFEMEDGLRVAHSEAKRLAAMKASA